MKIHGNVGFLKSTGEFHRFVGKVMGFSYRQSASWYWPRYEDKGGMFLSYPHYIIIDGLKAGYFTTYLMGGRWYVAASKSILKSRGYQLIITDYLVGQSSWLLVEEDKHITTGIAYRDSGYAYKIIEKI